MSSIKVTVKWGKEQFRDVEVDTSEEPILFKAQLFALTGVQPNRQKVLLKGATLKDDSWAGVKIKDGATVLLMGSKEDIPVKPVQETRFVEDMDESELQSAMEMPAGLTNLGNTCYMNATVQCLRTVPEFKRAVLAYKADISTSSSDISQSIASALRDLYKTMDRGQTVPPIILLQVLHLALPRFAEKSEHGGYQQQDANECWIELLRILQERLPPEQNANAKSVIDQYFGSRFDTETKCVESESEPAVKASESFLQYSCYIDKDVKYLHSGLKNRLTESLHKFSATLDRDAEHVKTLRLSRLPAYLTVQMVRFHFKQKEAVNAKVLKDIKYPIMLDTFDFCSEELQQKLLPMRTKFKEYEDYAVENQAKKKDMSREGAIKADQDEKNAAAAGKADGEDNEFEHFSFEDDQGSNNSGYYELQAILTHKGRSSNSGHYVAWVRQKGDTWIECNDDDVSPVHAQDILKLSGGGDWHTAYLLLYGPRRLRKFEVTTATAAAAAAADEEMEATTAAEADAAAEEAK